MAMAEIESPDVICAMVMAEIESPDVTRLKESVFNVFSQDFRLNLPRAS